MTKIGVENTKVVIELFRNSQETLEISKFDSSLFKIYVVLHKLFGCVLSSSPCYGKMGHQLSIFVFLTAFGCYGGGDEKSYGNLRKGIF